MKRILVSADGIWNLPEEDLNKDFPTSVLSCYPSLARDGCQCNRLTISPGFVFHCGQSQFTQSHTLYVLNHGR